MKHWKHLLTVLALALCSPALALAQKSAPATATGLDRPKLLNAVACNASEAARTYTAPGGQYSGYAYGVFQVDATWTADWTGLTITCTGSLNGGSTFASVPSCDDVSDGACALTGAGLFTRAMTVSENFMFRAWFHGAEDAKCVFTCTGGGADDLFTVWGRMAVQ